MMIFVEYKYQEMRWQIFDQLKYDYCHTLTTTLPLSYIDTLVFKGRKWNWQQHQAPHPICIWTMTMIYHVTITSYRHVFMACASSYLYSICIMEPSSSWLEYLIWLLRLLQVGFVCRKTNTCPGVYMGFIRHKNKSPEKKQRHITNTDKIQQNAHGHST